MKACQRNGHKLMDSLTRFDQTRFHSFSNSMIYEFAESTYLKLTLRKLDVDLRLKYFDLSPNIRNDMLFRKLTNF